MQRFYYRLRVRPQMPVQPVGGGTVLLRQAWRTLSLHTSPESAREALLKRLANADAAHEKAIVSYQGRQVLPLNPPQRASDTRCGACRTYPKTDGLKSWCACGPCREGSLV